MQDSTSVHPDSQYSLEIWKPIPGYETLYEASSLGRIKSLKGGRSIKSGHMLKGFTSNGYRYVSLTKNGEATRFSVHRLVLMTFDPIDPESKLEVNHINGKSGDNRLTNLEWVSRSENMLHMTHVLKRQRLNTGDQIGTAKLTVEQVRAIRRLHECGAYKCQLATLFNVSTPTINAIIKRKTWKHII